MIFIGKIAAIAFAAGAVIGAATSGGVVWDMMSTKLDLKVAEHKLSMATFQASIDKEVGYAKVAREEERKLRDEKALISAALLAANKRVIEAGTQKATELRIEYVTEDPNANNCGFSAAGMCVWNTAATADSGRALSEAECPGPGDNEGAIVARNAEISRAGVVSFAAHLDAILQINQLKAHINDKCSPVDE